MPGAPGTGMALCTSFWNEVNARGLACQLGDAGEVLCGQHGERLKGDSGKSPLCLFYSFANENGFQHSRISWKLKNIPMGMCTFLHTDVSIEYMWLDI